MIYKSTITTCSYFGGFAIWLALSCEAAKAIDFEKEIRPVLQSRCVECHGTAEQNGDLRLDAKQFAMAGGQAGPAIVAASSNSSPLYHRIISTDEDEMMPPKGERLSPEQTALIRDWIDAGAVWTETDADREASQDPRMKHWSVQPLRTDFPADASIDSFVGSKLQEHNLSISPQADRMTLIRRLSFDLLGLPPSPEIIAEFATDGRADAYERLVDVLLTSPHYGERWARHWLDVAHYADTHGFERDMIRPNAWRYRDYVIDSLNNDKPYNHFIVEQIAGDVLAPDDPNKIVATGFLAAGPWDFVGHVETPSPVLNRAARAGDLDDMLTQVIASTMGITVNCARCHDHKLDPIKQTEYYGLAAVFAGTRRGDRAMNERQAAVKNQQKVSVESRLVQSKAKLARLKDNPVSLADMVGGGDGYGTGKANIGITLGNGKWTQDKLGFLQDIEANRLTAIGDDKPNTEQPTRMKGVFLPNGKVDNAKVELAEGIEIVDLPITDGTSWDAIRNGPLNAQVNTKLGDIDYATADHSILGLHSNAAIVFDLDVIRKDTRFREMKLQGMVGFGCDMKQSVATDSQGGFAVYLDGVRKLLRDNFKKTDSVALDVSIPLSTRFLTLLASDGGDGIGHDLMFIGDAKLVSSDASSSKPIISDGEIDLAKQDVDALQRELDGLSWAEVQTVYTVVPQSTTPIIHVQRRGNPEDETVEVTPSGFAWPSHAIPDFGDQSTPEGERRLRLAQWIIDPNNPLTWRVLVNRLWHHHFGQGLVRTPSDFGLGGDMPSHPELLDYLANELRTHGYSMKYIHRLIVTSETYKQRSSNSNELATQVDSSNRLLWRQNLKRLDAESLRDAVLAVAGSLDTKMGGPGYRDFEYTEEYAPIYKYVSRDDPDLNRRSIYRFIVRTTPQVFLTTFDCPDPANLTPARVTTTNAIQALAMSNDEFILKQANEFSKRVTSETDNDQAAIRLAFKRALLREPSSVELQSSLGLVAKYGLFTLCRMLLNTNEFIYVD